jgi:hypothetical protein
MAATDVNSNLYDLKWTLVLPMQATFIKAAETFTAAHMGEAGDTRRAARLEAGITLCYAWLKTSAIDTNAVATAVHSLEVTDGTTTKTLVHQLASANSGAVAVQLGGQDANEDGIGYKLGTPAAGSHWWLRLITDTVAATEGAAGAYEAIVGYTNQPNEVD